MTEPAAAHDYIAPAIRHLAKPIADLSLDPANARQHSPRNLETIAASLRRFGQQRPILVDSKGVVRAGNGTLTAARSLGWSHIAVVTSDLQGSDLTAFAIADNRSGDPEVGSTWDASALALQLEALSAEGLGEVTGFTGDEIAAMLSREAPAGADGGTDLDESIADDVKMMTCPHCGQEFPL